MKDNNQICLTIGHIANKPSSPSTKEFHGDLKKRESTYVLGNEFRWKMLLQNVVEL